MNNNLIVFVKDPLCGNVKTRLGKAVGADNAKTLYRCFVEDTLSNIVKVDSKVYIFCYPEESLNSIKEWLGPEFIYLPQKGNNLGERMANSFSVLFSNGCRKATVIGTDTPHLSATDINRSFKLLVENDVVIGPAVDGGYYLLGINKDAFSHDIFSGIKWSSEEVFEKTIKILDDKKLKTYILKKRNDIDTGEDLLYVYNTNMNNDFNKTKTFLYLNSNKELLK